MRMAPGFQSSARKAVLFERLLARLRIAASERWLLKGAPALDLRFGACARAPNDMHRVIRRLVGPRAVALDDLRIGCQL